MPHVVNFEATLSWPPRRRWTALASSTLMHATAAAAVVFLGPASAPLTVAAAQSRAIDSAIETRHIVFVVSRPNVTAARGGGGGGNRQTAPIRHAEGVGADAITLRVATPMSSTGRVTDAPALPGLLLHAKPLASGSVDQVGLPVGGVSSGSSTGSGSGGGVGEGLGTGVGSGRGQGLGAGSGGGIGGGAYRPGGSVSAPRVIAEAKPTYTTEALAERIQGSVVLEVVVQANGEPSNIRIVHSLDPGLDEQAVKATRQWRFEPGRLGGMPVDVLVTIILDFWIR